MLKPKKQLGTHKQIKQDKLVTYFFLAQDWLEKYRKQITYIALAILAIVVFSFYSQSVGESREQEASVILARGKNAFDGARYREATNILGPLTSQYKGTKSAGFGTILLARSFLLLEQYDEAERYFRAYLDEYGDDDLLRIAALAGIASCYDMKGDYLQAGQAYEEAARADQNEVQAPELLMSAARCYHLADDVTNARRVLKELTEKYPESQIVTTAQEMLHELGA